MAETSLASDEVAGTQAVELRPNVRAVPAAPAPGVDPIAAIRAMFMIINMRLIMVLAVLGSWFVWGWAVVNPTPWSWAAGIGYSLGVIVPLTVLYARKGGEE